MLRKRLISVLLFNDGVLFRTKEFVPDYRYTANFVDAWSIDEIVLLDVTRPGEGRRESFEEVLRQFSRRCFVPLAAGGGIRTVEDVQGLLRLGADKVVLNTQALRQPELITRLSELYGCQCVVVSIDARRHPDGRYETYARFGSEPTGRDPADWAQEAQRRGAGEILVSSIDKDGSLEGYDLALSRRVAEAVTVPVLVSGGAGKWQDFVDAFTRGGASAACTSCIYHFTESSIKSAKAYLKQAGIDVRFQ